MSSSLFPSHLLPIEGRLYGIERTRRSIAFAVCLVVALLVARRTTMTTMKTRSTTKKIAKEEGRGGGNDEKVSAPWIATVSDALFRNTF